MKTSVKNVVCIGGGTGNYTVLSGLKQYPELNLSAIVAMADSGGSTGKLRDDLKILPPGDVRQCLIALSKEDDLMREVFTYRFEQGDLMGHNLGNIILAGLEKITGSFKKAVETASSILAIQGKVIPMALNSTDLVAELVDGQVIFGETNISDGAEEKRPKIKRVFLSPAVKVNPDASKAILAADLVVLGPGCLYTSVIPNLLVSGILPAFQKTKAPLVYICNLMTKFGQTDNMTAAEHLAEVEKYLHRPVDIMLLNNRKIPAKGLSAYKQAGESVVETGKIPKRIKVISTDLLNEKIFTSSKDNPEWDIQVRRSLIRHSPAKIAKVLTDVIHGRSK